MSGGIIYAEWKSVKKEYPDFQRAMRDLDNELISLCDGDWKSKTLGYLTPSSGQYGRTTILPALFKDNAGSQMVTWRQNFTSTGHQAIIIGAGSGNTIPEDFKVGWIGLAFPNKQQQLSEIRFQIGDRKYGRINLEDLESYNVPALIFEKGFVINEEQSFELYGYIKETDYQRIVMLGTLYYKVLDKVLGEPGSAIS